MKAKNGKRIDILKHLIFTIFSLFCHSLLCGQSSTEGKDFWLAFGSNYDDHPDSLTLQIRVVTTKTTNVTLTFTATGTTVTVPVAANSVYTRDLSSAEKTGSYSTGTGVSKKSIHIQSDENVSVYAINLQRYSTDATNILPTSALHRSYYSMSYFTGKDGYTLIAVTDNTRIYVNGAFVARLQRGEVYSKYSDTDMTGQHITADLPIAFFVTNPCTYVPLEYKACDCLYTQLFPEKLWGKEFMIPVTIRGTERVRVAASTNGTVIKHTGGTLMSGSLNLNAGQFAELEIRKSEGGCRLSSNNPVGVTSYLTGIEHPGLVYLMGDPAESWVAPLEQMVREMTIAPFVAAGSSILEEHHAMIVVNTKTRNMTEIKTGSGNFAALSGGAWTDHSSGYSFYSMPMTLNTGYTFKNPDGLILYSYGLGEAESYYYMAGSSILRFDALFNVNGVHCQDFDGTILCIDDSEINVEAVVEYQTDSSPGHLRWFFDGVEETAFRDIPKWTKKTELGEHEIKMTVRDVYGDEESRTTRLSVIRVAGKVTPDRSVCRDSVAGELYLALSADGMGGTYSYQWQSADESFAWTDASGATETVHSPGALTETRYFRCRIEESHCGSKYSDSAKIAVYPQLSAGTVFGDQLICFDTAPAQMQVTPATGGAGNYSYQWFVFDDSLKKMMPVEGATEANHSHGKLRETRMFIRRTTDSECGTVDSDIVKIATIPETYIMPDELSPYRRNVEYRQNFASNAFSPRFFSDDLPEGLFIDPSGYLYGKISSHEVSTPTITIALEDAYGCNASREYLLSGEIYVPNAFTPNGDGVNDVFMPGFRVVIIDRFGVPIHKGNDGWNGSFNGKRAPADIYFYVLTYNVNNKDITLTGYVGLEY